MRKTIFVFAALLLVGCSKPADELTPQGHLKTYDDLSSDAAANASRQDGKPAPKAQPKSEMMDYMRSHTPKQEKGGFEVAKGAFK